MLGRGKYVAPPPSSYGLLPGGLDTGVYSSTNIKYEISADTTSSAAAINSARQHPQGAGNTVTGTIAGGYNAGYSTAVQRWAYAGSSWAAGTSLSTGNSNTCAAANSTTGMYVGGDNNRTTNLLYDIGAGTWSTGNAIGTGISHGGGTSTSSSGYIFAGNSPIMATISEYSWSGTTWDTTYSLNYATLTNSCAGNTTKAVSVAGYNAAGNAAVTNVDNHVYSTHTSTAQTALATARISLCQGIGDATYAIAVGGQEPPGYAKVATSYKYTFSSDARTAGATLADVRSDGAGLSSSPGGI